MVVAAPVGFVKDGDRYEKDPDRRVQEAITLVFDKVEALGSARQAVSGADFRADRFALSSSFVIHAPDVAAAG